MSASEGSSSSSADGGKKGKVLDAEQAKKYDEIIELLLAAGYFRARIATLSSFDKVIGGLAWCITNSQIDVDVDIFFQENSNIRLQIKLGEAIEKALIRMRCPFRLQSYQIRGLDFISIFDVIQWLVKRVIEVREETGDLLRINSEWNFKKRYRLPTDRDFDNRKDGAVSYMKAVAYKYRPNRLYRKRDDMLEECEEDRVQSTLLEFGHKAYRTVQPKKDAMSAKQKLVESAISGSSKDLSADAKAQEDRKFARMMKGMEQTGSDDISGNMVRGLFGQESEDFRRMDQELGQQSAESAVPLSGKSYEEEAHKRHVEALEAKIERLKERLAEEIQPFKELRNQLKALEAQLEEKVSRNNSVIAEMEEFDRMVTPDNKETVETLRSLIYLLENLKRQQKIFETNCTQQYAYLKRKIEELANSPIDEAQVERLASVTEMHEKTTQSLIRNRQALNKKIRDIKMVERQMDEIPSRAELQQYQLQFIELYEQVASKFTETKKYFQSYNRLEDSRSYLDREIGLLNSIHDNYKIAMKSDKTKGTLVEQIRSILTTVDSNLEKKKRALNEDKQTLHELNEQYAQLVERERTYYKVTKDFEEECVNNRKLLALLKEPEAAQ